MRDAEVVVIGGGSSGTSIAYHMAKLGQKGVFLVEKSFLAFGATGRSAAIIRCHYPHKETSKMALKSLRFFEKFDKIVRGRSGFIKTGLLVIVAPRDEGKLRQTVDMQKEVGVKVRALSRDDVAKMEPRISVDDIAIGAYEPQAGYADSSAYVTSLGAKAEEMGVKILQKTKVTGIDVSNGRVRAVKTDSGTIATKRIVCATGAWSQEIGDMLSIRFPLSLRRSKLALIKRPADFGETHPIIFDIPPDVYYRPDGEKTIVGGSAPTSTEGLPVSDPDAFKRIYLNPDGFKESLEPEEVRGFVSKSMLRFPIFEKAFYQGGWAGISDDTPDGYPVLSDLPGTEGFYCAFGMSGHGFKLSPMIGKAMAELVVEGRSKDFDMKEFRYTRFEEGKPIQVPLEYSWGQGS